MSQADIMQLSNSSFRLNGVARYLTNYAPIVPAVMTVVALYFTRFNTRYLITIPLMLIAVMLNSRSAMVLVIIGAIFVLFFNEKRISIHIKYVSIIGCIVLLCLPILIYVSSNYSDTRIVSWINSGIKAIISFISPGQENIGYFSYFSTSNRFLLPDSLSQLFFGAGFNVYKEGTVIAGFQSDVGYINYIWIGGIVYEICLWIYILYLIKPLLKNSDVFVKWLALFMIITCLIMNIKDTLFGVNEFMNFLFILALFYYSAHVLSLTENERSKNESLSLL
jgi:hypothetical protein